MGERDFEFRITADTEHIDYAAEEFNMQPFALSFFPSGDGERNKTEINIDNKDIIMTRCALDGKGNLLIRIYNTSEAPADAEVTVDNNKFCAKFAPFEIKTVIFNIQKVT